MILNKYSIQSCESKTFDKNINIFHLKSFPPLNERQPFEKKKEGKKNTQKQTNKQTSTLVNVD